MKHLNKIVVAMMVLVLLSALLSACQVGTSKGLSKAEKTALYEGTYNENSQTGGDTYYGVGRTINVIEDEYVEVLSGYKKVFDAKKLLNLNWRKTNVGEMEAKTAVGNSMQHFMSDFNLNFKDAFSASAQIKGFFKANIENSFGFSAGIKYENTANEIYFNSSQIYSSTLIEIDEYYDLSQFYNLLSQDLINAVEAVQNKTMSPKEFFRLYGTHTILAGYYGGRIDCNYYMRNLAAKWDVNFESNIMNKIGAEIAKLGSVSNSTEFSISEKLGLDSSKMEERFSASSTGGVNFAALTLKDYMDNYKVWVDSLNNQDLAHSRMVGFPKNSLASIWDLLPNKYAEAKNILNTYFDELASSESNEFLKQYERHFIETEPPFDPEEPNEPAIKTNVQIAVRKDNSNSRKVSDVSSGIYEDYYLDLDFEELEKQGYTKLKFTIKFNIKEIHDGYQHLQLFLNDRSKKCKDESYEHGGNGRNDKWSTEYYKYYETVNIGEMSSKKITLKFSSTGLFDWLPWGANEWMLGETIVQVQAVK